MPEYNLKNLRQDFKSKGIFYTQPELALFLKGLLPDGVDEVYDPTCGSGNLLSVFGDDVRKYGQDVNTEQLEVARGHLTNFTGYEGDTLTSPAFPPERFRFIVANPPFSIRWEPQWSDMFEGWPALPPRSKADYAFIAHILSRLTDDGTAAMLEFPGILYRGQSEGKIRQYLIERNYIDTVIHIDGNHFVDTSIATCALVLKKRRDTTDITFAHGERTRVVPVEEVARNGYNLSVSTYIQEEEPKEEIDPLALEMGARKALLEHLEKDLAMERLVCRMEGLDIEPFLRDIEAIIAKCRRETRAQDRA